MPKIQITYKLNLLFKLSVFVLINLCGIFTSAQMRDMAIIPVDTNLYFTEYPKLLALQIFTQTRTNKIDVVHDNDALHLRPNGMTNIGMGASWHGIAINLSFGMPKTGGRVEKYGKTKKFDIQFSSMMSRFYFDGFLNSYKGYYNKNPEDFVEWNKNYFPQLPDLKVSAIGASGLYIFNYKKYSYKAAYKRTAVQHKSAGSFALGIYGNFDDVNSSNGFIPEDFPDSVKNNFDLKGFSNLAVGISFGYMYTFVLWKNVFLNLAAFPGVGIQRSNLTTLEGEVINSSKIGEQIKGTVALGYEHKSFYLGITGSATLRILGYNDYDIDLSTEQFRFFIGKRFSL